MRYIMRNRIFGLKVTCGSEKSRDNFLASAKRENGEPVWELFETVEDEAKIMKHQELSDAEIMALVEARGLGDVPRETKVVEDDLADARIAYMNKFGKKPHHKLGVDKILEKLGEDDGGNAE